MNLFNNHNEPNRPVLSFSDFDQKEPKSDQINHEQYKSQDIDFEAIENVTDNSAVSSDFALPKKHPFKEKVVRAFNRKNILENFDWNTIYFDVKKRAPYLIIMIIILSAMATYLTVKTWSGKQVYVAGSKLLYKEIKFDSKQILPTSTSLAMIEHKDLIQKALLKLPEYESAEELKSATKINFDKKTKIIRIDVSSDSDEQSIKAANILSELALEASQQFYYTHFQEKFSNLSRQIMLSEQNMFVQDKLIAESMKKTGALNVREQYRILMEGISLQKRNLLEAQIDHKKRKVQLDVLKNEYAKMPDEVVRNSYEDNPLKAQLTNTKMALLSAQSIYGESNPNILAIKEKIAGLKKQLASQDIKSTLQKVYMPNTKKQEVYMEIARAEGELKSAENRITSIVANIKAQRVELFGVPDKEMELDDALRKREGIAELLDTLRKKHQDVEIMMRSEIRDIDLYEVADQAVLIQPMKLLVIPPAVLIFAIGLSFVYLLISCVLDQSIRTKKQLSIGFTIPCVMQLASSHEFDRHLFKELKSMVDNPLQQEFKNIICIQSDGESEAAEDLTQYWLRQDKKVLLCEYKTSQDEFPLGEENMINIVERGELLNRAVLTLPSTESDVHLLDKIKEMSLEYDYIIIDIPDKSCDKTQLNLINISDWYFFVVNACKTSRMHLVQRLKEMEFKGVCPEGFILDEVNDSLIQV